MPDYEELIREWSNEQGFTVWACDHAAVLLNLSKWMDKRGGAWVSADIVDKLIGYAQIGWMFYTDPQKKELSDLIKKALE